MPYLYRYEAKSIQAYVVGTGKLREIAGASALVEGLAATAAARLPAPLRERLVAAAGGGTMLFPDASSLEAFVKTWILDCALQLPGLHMTHGWVEVPAEGKVTDEVWQQLRVRLDADRQRRVLTEPLASPLVARAPRTGRPAVARQGGLPLDAAMKSRLDEYARQCTLHPDALFGRCFPESLRTGPYRLRPVEDTDDLGEGYVAVVHADGNGLGKVFSSLPYDRYREVSEAIAIATQKAVHAAVLGLAQRDVEGIQRGRLRFRPIVLGGDDFTAILSASAAIPFVTHFLEAFEGETRTSETLVGLGGGQGFTAAAGIAFVKAAFPFSAALGLAEELCGRAKKPFRRWESSRVPSALAFHRVTTAGLRSYQEIQKEELAAVRVGRVCAGALAGGPWTLGSRSVRARSIDALDELSRHLSIFPRGALREWLSLAAADERGADAAWRRVLDVAGLRRDSRARELLDALKGAGCPDGSPWGKHPCTNEESTPMLDALVYNRLAGPEGPARWR